MTIGSARARDLDPGPIGLAMADLPPLPDDLSDPAAAWINAGAWFEAPDRPLELEIGSGKGTFLVDRATRLPDRNFIGVEWAREYWLYAADRLRRRALDNVRMLHADATAFLRWRIADGTFAIIHLYFSDPWPKPRHHKRRVVQDAFLADAHRTLVPGGELRIVTDHADYWAWMERRFDRWTDPATTGERGGRAFERIDFDDARRHGGEGELVGTNFERKYAEEGRPFFATVLKKME
jgi:tRNA (guanine-N7-)-methyltransferase